MSTSQNFFQSELRKELQHILIRTAALRFASGFVSFLAISAWVFLAVVLWAAVSGAPPLWQVLTVSRVLLVVLAGLFGYFIVYPLLRLPSLRTLTHQVESREDFKDILAAGYEFSQSDEAERRYSPVLVREVIRQAVHSVSGLQVRFLFLTGRQVSFVPVAYLALVVLAAMALVAPGVLLDAGKRLTSPRDVAAIEHAANLYARPGNITVLAGTDVEVSAFDFGGSDEPVRVSYNLSESFWKTKETHERDVYFAGEARTEHAYTFEAIRNSVSYYFQAGDRRSPTYRIQVVNNPIVTELEVVLTPPEYTSEPSDTLSASGGNIQALEGTHVSIRARTNNTLEGAWVQYDELPRVRVEFAGQELSFDFIALKDGTYSIHLEDNLNHETDAQLVYGIEVYQDNPPVLDVLEPGGDASLPRSQRIDVSFVASDDYGVRKAKIYFRKSGEERFRRKSIPLGEDKDRKDVAKKFTWDLGDITLFPGNYVEYFLEVQDNNVVTGPGVTKSRMYHVTVPTMAQLYEQIKEEDARRTDLIDEALSESRELKERIERLSREFKKTEELDWTQQKEIDKAISSQEDIQSKLQDITKSLEETMQSLSDNRMTSQEIGEKLEEISKLMKEINSDELEKYIEDLQKAMEKLSPEEIRKALENLNMTTEELMKSLERTASLLREIAKEQQMEEIVRKAQDLMESQEELREKTAEANESDPQEMDDLSGEQEDLADQASDLEKDLEDLAEMMNEDQDAMAEEMEQMSEKFKESETSDKMQEASESLQQQQQQQAMQQQQEAQDKMVSLFNKAARMQMDMNMMSQRRAAANLQRLAKSTLEISFKQEQFATRVREAISNENTDPRLLTREQQMYERAVAQIADELEEIGRKDVMIPHQLIELLGETLTNMNSSLLFLEQKKAFMSATTATTAVTNLNQVTMELLSAAQQCSQGQGQGQSKLQQMLDGQRQMMQQTESMLGMQAMKERLLQQRQAELRRLSSQQRSLQDLAREIQQDLKENRVLGRMDRIIDEMEEVLKDLESGIVDEGTLRNEERILSRLLDAERSVHTRDYEKKRLSVAADDVFSEGGSDPNKQRTPQMLREEIRRAMTLQAPGEFEALIKLYFRALADEALSARGSN